MIAYGVCIWILPSYTISFEDLFTVTGLQHPHQQSFSGINIGLVHLRMNMKWESMGLRLVGWHCNQARSDVNVFGIKQITTQLLSFLFTIYFSESWQICRVIESPNWHWHLQLCGLHSSLLFAEHETQVPSQLLFITPYRYRIYNLNYYKWLTIIRESHNALLSVHRTSSALVSDVWPQL